MALHSKLDALDALKPDVAVISEMARPEIVARKAGGVNLDSAFWDGAGDNKGIGVLTNGCYRAEVDSSYQPENSYVVPLRVSGTLSFNLLAVWSHNNRKQKGRRTRPGPILRALEASAGFCREGPLIVAGDFNNHVIWDKPGKPNNMAAIADALAEFGLVSAYHASRRVGLGEEPEPTLYWRNRTADGPSYHIDYVFIPADWAVAGFSFEVGGYADWVGNGLSDHVPLVLTVHEN